MTLTLSVKKRKISIPIKYNITNYPTSLPFPKKEEQSKS
jgi:hypothetical protein